MGNRAKKFIQLADCESWKSAPYAASSAFLEYCEQLKMWPGDSTEAWEHFYAGWLAKEAKS